MYICINTYKELYTERERERERERKREKEREDNEVAPSVQHASGETLTTPTVECQSGQHGGGKSGGPRWP